ncbi:MAG: threonine/serine dehydratase [Alphaproteobacteria bacterium]|nr:threonine/serine dehydratase [Alphaproteobacteria bacterium]
MADDGAARLPGLPEIETAARRLAGQAVATPLLSSPLLDARIGARILVKAESLQRTGSFKFRGALNTLLSLSPDARKRGVVAFSSGNHAQGVAAAAQLLKIPATIVMPADAPAIKTANTRAYGATIVPYDRHRDSREAIADSIARREGATLVPPFDDVRIIAGQGTVGLELARQATALGIALDVVIAPCSGGGLVGGIALALAALSPATRVYAAEPESLDDLRRSLAAGLRIANEAAARSICDSLLAPMPGVLPFAIARRHLAGSLTVGDDDVRRAMAAAFADLKLVLEPGGAAALAAILSGKLDCAGKTVAVIASGGNVDRELFAAALACAAPAS